MTKLDTLTNLSGKVVIITGSGAGIGRETAILLAQAGASIMAMENKVPMIVFALDEENSIINAANGKITGTEVTVD